MMNNKEAIRRIRRHMIFHNLEEKGFYITEALNMAIEALEREQAIIENGYTGKEMQIRIGGRLFAVRELPQ